MVATYLLLIDIICVYSRIIKLIFIIIYEICKYDVYKSINYLCNKHTNRLYLIINISKRLEYENIVYVKLFQALCLNNDLLSSNEQDYLLKYTDNVPYTNEEIDFELLGKLTRDYSITLSNNTPINSGIIGLVFDGYDSSKNKVIIKMLKRDIFNKFIKVFDELLHMSYICAYIPYIKSLKISKLILDNKEVLLNQMNFTKEAEAIEIFTYKYKNNKEFRFPKVYREITEKYKDILVMENICGLKFRDIEIMDETIKEEFAYLLNKFNILGLLYHSIIHCDLHSGNLFFYINNELDASNNIIIPKYMLGIIDFGICSFPNKESQNAYYIFFDNMFYNHDYSNIEYIINIFTEENNKINSFNSTIKQRLCDETIYCLEMYANHKITNQALVNKLGEIFYKYDLNFTQEFNKIILSLHTAHSSVKLLSSNVNIAMTKVITELNYFNRLITI